MYFTCREAIQNATKHARGRDARGRDAPERRRALLRGQRRRGGLRPRPQRQRRPAQHARPDRDGRRPADRRVPSRSRPPRCAGSCRCARRGRSGRPACRRSAVRRWRWAWRTARRDDAMPGRTVSGHLGAGEPAPAPAPADRGRGSSARLGRGVAAWLLPGVDLESTGAAFLVAAVIASCNAIVPPLLAALRLPFTVALGFLLVLARRRAGAAAAPPTCCRTTSTSTRSPTRCSPRS